MKKEPVTAVIDCRSSALRLSVWLFDDCNDTLFQVDQRFLSALRTEQREQLQFCIVPDFYSRPTFTYRAEYPARPLHGRWIILFPTKKLSS